MASLMVFMTSVAYARVTASTMFCIRATLMRPMYSTSIDAMTTPV